MAGEDIKFSVGPLIERISHNVKQEVIVTTRDKLELCLLKHQISMSDRNSWQIPASICISTTIAWATSDFKNILLGGATWKAMFILSSIASAIWFSVAFLRRIRIKTIEDIIQDVRVDRQNQNQQKDEPKIVRRAKPSGSASGT